MRILAENENQKITGAFFADIKPWWDGPRMIDGELFVDSNQQSKGIGSILLRTLLNRARENYQATYFETITFMPESIHPLKWYMDIGFEKVDNLTVINGNIEQTLKKLKA
jgi:GNAT superfamily N-acetyltransferase